MKKLIITLFILLLPISVHAQTDVAIGIEQLLPAAQYIGSTTDNIEAQFNALVWTDVRPKPTWQAVVDAYDAYVIQKPLDDIAEDKQNAKDSFDERDLKAFVKILIDEINILRGNHGLADRTVQQLKNAIEAEIDAQP